MGRGGFTPRGRGGGGRGGRGGGRGQFSFVLRLLLRNSQKFDLLVSFPHIDTVTQVAVEADSESRQADAEVVVAAEEVAADVAEDAVVAVEAPEVVPKSLSSHTDTVAFTLPRAKKTSSLPKTWFQEILSTERRKLRLITYT